MGYASNMKLDASDEFTQELFLGAYLFEGQAIRLGRRSGWLDVALSLSCAFFDGVQFVLAKGLEGLPIDWHRDFFEGKNQRKIILRQYTPKVNSMCEKENE